MPITISHKGSLSKTFKFLMKIHSFNFQRKLEKYGQKGVDALRAATPRDTGKTAESWSYEIHTGIDSVEVVWSNSNNNHGVYIAVLIQYGHGTRNGGYVHGVDYINPALQPIFDEMADDIWSSLIEDKAGDYSWQQ